MLLSSDTIIENLNFLFHCRNGHKSLNNCEMRDLLFNMPNCYVCVGEFRGYLFFSIRVFHFKISVKKKRRKKIRFDK